MDTTKTDVRQKIKQGKRFFTDVATGFRMQKKGKGYFYKFFPLDDDIELYWTGRIDDFRNEKLGKDYIHITIDELEKILGEGMLNRSNIPSTHSAAFFITKGMQMASHFSLPAFEKGKIPERFMVDEPTFVNIETKIKRGI